MAEVIELQEYRVQRELLARHAGFEPIPKPVISDADIFGRDYTRLKDVVFGILKIREILAYYLYLNEGWQHLLFCLLEAVYTFQETGTPEVQADLTEVVMYLREHILDSMDIDNKKDLLAAMLILDLIERSPGFKAVNESRPPTGGG